MLRLAADENFNGNIVRGLLRHKPDLDLVRVQDVGLSGVDDATLLEWTGPEGRVLLTHDVTTITRFVQARVDTGKAMPGVFAVSQSVPVQRVIEDLLLLTERSLDAEWDGQIRYLPL